MRLLIAIGLLVCLQGCMPERADPSGRDKPALHGSEDGASGRAPVVDDVSISPARPWVDGPVECSASFHDPDGGSPRASYSWLNQTTGEALGSGRTVELTPSKVTPGDIVRCEVEVSDSDGHRTSAHVDGAASCGFYDEASLRDVDVDIYIIFRPYITEDLEPGYGGEPWDWDGDIPDWLIEVVGALSDLADVLAWVYPDPSVLTAQEALDWAEDILAAIEEYGPGLLAATVPPDPNVVPYAIDADGNIYGGSDGISWDDTYEITLSFSHVDLRPYLAVAFDMEDEDIAFDDNMGDWLDQGSTPLVLTNQLLLDGAYCTTTWYNPREELLETETALVPSSVLWMTVEVR